MEAVATFAFEQLATSQRRPRHHARCLAELLAPYIATVALRPESAAGARMADRDEGG